MALEARYRLPDVYVSGVDKLHRSDNGVGYTLGVGPRFALGKHVGVGVSAEYLNSTSQSRFWLFSALLEYHFR